MPNLVETVKGYAAHEKSVFENVTKGEVHGHAGNHPGGDGESRKYVRDTLKSLFAVAEAYPELKANTNFL